MAEGELTPMMKQYHGLRRGLPEDCILLFRLGDFYEMFFEDATVAAGILNLALTKRNSVPMCGVPYHASESYIRRLVQAGKRVAIGEQVGEAVPGKLVERELSQIISAGTVLDMNMLDNRQNNFLAGVYKDGKKFGLSFLDHTTGEFRLAEFPNLAAVQDEVTRINPVEILYSTEQTIDFGSLKAASAADGYTFLYDQAYQLLRDHFAVQSLDGFGCYGLRAAVGAAGAILHYVKTTLHRKVDHLRKLQTYEPENFVLIDAASRGNLDLVNHRGGNEYTLLHALDRTHTPMGARKLREWILHPLRDLETLVARQDFIASLLAEPFILTKLQDALKGIRDLERTTGRLGQLSGNARDVQVLCTSLQQVPDLQAHFQALLSKQPEDDGESASLLQRLLPRLRHFPELVEYLRNAIVDEPPASLKDGGIFRETFSPELTELRLASTQGKQWLADLQEREINRTGIKSLKVKFNAVFGYFIEITKSNVGQVPDDYVRKQTTSTGERYYTPELKSMEDKILGADERMKRLEYDAFCQLRSHILTHMDDIQDTADALAEVDVLCGLAETARLYNYCRPLLNNSLNLHIKDGRHPVVDQNLTDEKFVPNDTLLEPQKNRLLIITGPNMAGKSTYIRQTALLVLMAQLGSYIPASQAEIGLVDRIFTRVGASDDLSKGQSTFMVEMNETAAILNNATSRSLVILDEIGRGTATFDGLSIAWSVAEHLHDTIQCRTLFATHYHELTALATKRDAVQNYNVAVREWNDRIIFLRKIVAGAADKSYGIQVARLAGLPKEIIDRAKEILSHLESGNITTEAPPNSGNTPAEPKKPRQRSAQAVNGPDSLQAEFALF
jgi:DNA mismatch repair protein MutS